MPQKTTNTPMSEHLADILLVSGEDDELLLENNRLHITNSDVQKILDSVLPRYG